MDTIVVEKIQPLAIQRQEKHDLLLLEKANKGVVLEQGFSFKHNSSFNNTEDRKISAHQCQADHLR